MATKYLRLRALATLVAFGSLLPIACDGDDEGNPTPGTGGTGAKGGTGGTGAKGGKGGKGGSSGSSGQAGDTGTGGSTGGSTTGGSAGKGGSGGKGGSAGKGGSGAKGGTGNVGGDDAGGSGGEPTNPGTDCTELLDSNDYDAPCYQDCTPVKTDDSEQFLNRCSDGSQTLGGVHADCTPWSGTLNALGDGCTKVGPGCVLPALP